MFILGMVIVYFASLVGVWIEAISWGEWSIIALLFFGFLAIIKKLEKGE